MIDSFPSFVLRRKRDHRLLWDSPCIDAGNPDLTDLDGTRSDMGSHFFDQNDHLTLYLTPDMVTVPQGSKLGVTYTLINRWDDPQTCLISTKLYFPNGMDITLIGPEELSIPGQRTEQVRIIHSIPTNSPTCAYQYWSSLEAQPPALLDEDFFYFRVKQNPVFNKIPVEW